MAHINLVAAQPGVHKTSAPEISGKLKVAVFVLLAAGVIILGCGMYLRVTAIFQERGLSEVIKRRQQHEELVRTINSLKVELATLNQEKTFLENFIKQELGWSAKLKTFADLMPEEIWLNRLSYDKRGSGFTAGGTLTIKGGLVPQDKMTPLGTLSAFLNRLTSENVFSNFDAPVLKDMRSETYQKTEIMTFSVEMTLKKKDALLGTQL